MDEGFTFRKFNFRNDLADLFDLMTDARDQALFHCRFPVNSLPDFEKWMIANMTHLYHEFYVIVAKDNYSIVGYVYSYDYKFFDGHCKVCIFLKKQYRDVGMGALCGMRFMSDLFSSYPLRKIYIDVYDYNEQSLQCNLGIGFVEEGCLKDYRFLDGKYHDMHLLSITRDAFFEHKKKVTGKEE